MEMNTRLQVEHPVTEAVTGLDLVEWQLRVAQGEPLPLAQEQVRFQGHAIEVRLCAEDEHFTPHTGTVRHFRSSLPLPRGEGRGEGLRFDHALFEGLEVSPYYDSMLGKLIVHAAHARGSDRPPCRCVGPHGSCWACRPTAASSPRACATRSSAPAMR